MASKPEKCTRRVQFHFTDSLWLALLQAAAEDDRKVSQLVRHLLSSDARVKKFLHGSNGSGAGVRVLGDDAVFLRRPFVAEQTQRRKGRR